MSDAPERIWLQDDGDYPSAHEAGFGTESGVTWCDTSVNDRDTEYVRADHAQAELQAAVAAAYEDAAVIASDNVPATVKASVIRALTPVDALAARDARVRAEALRDIKEKTIEITALEEDETEENLKGYARGSYFAAKCILALIPADQEEEEQ